MRLSRRRMLTSVAAIAATATISAPYVRGAHAAGKLTMGLWDHWVPGANITMDRIINDWGAKNNVEVAIDHIASIGGKLVLTAAAEEAGGAGHDFLSYYGNWQTAVHRKRLEPVDDIVTGLIKQYGPLNPMIEYLTKHDGHFMSVPATAMSNLFPAVSRLDLYQQHTGLDLKKMFPAAPSRDQALADTWDWHLYLSSAEKLFKAGYPVGLPMGQTADTYDWISVLFRSFGSVFVDEKDNIKVDSDETRVALEYVKKLLAVNPPEVYAWDDAGNNKWLISGKGSSIFNPPSAWAVAVRDSPKVAEQCWHHDIPRGPKGRFAPYNVQVYGIWEFSKNKGAAKALITHLSQREQVQQLVSASHGYDIPAFQSFANFDTWAKEGPPQGTLYNYPLRGDNASDVVGYPARPDVASQITEQVVQPLMVAKVTAGGESFDSAIKWAASELESYLRA